VPDLGEEDAETGEQRNPAADLSDRCFFIKDRIGSAMIAFHRYKRLRGSRHIHFAGIIIGTVAFVPGQWTYNRVIFRKVCYGKDKLDSVSAIGQIQFVSAFVPE
jgi:hypothetical protein